VSFLTPETEIFGTRWTIISGTRNNRESIPCYFWCNRASIPCYFWCNRESIPCYFWCNRRSIPCYFWCNRDRSPVISGVTGEQPSQVSICLDGLRLTTLKGFHLPEVDTDSTLPRARGLALFVCRIDDTLLVGTIPSRIIDSIVTSVALTRTGSL
jgi:hypothetical protein